LPSVVAAQAQAIQDRALTYPCQIPLERNAKGVEELKTKGILVNEVPAAELAKIKDKDKPVVEKYTKLLGATLVKEVYAPVDKTRAQK
jgi:TRAP-type C4-dicarboxylate transport system substrate-binding protein